MSASGDYLAEMAREDEDDENLSELPVFYNEPRHIEKIKGWEVMTHTWRMKERMKTVSVALVLCLNVGVDPPDVLKTNPCARMEAWIEPSTQQPQKALEMIGASLQKQYERWQPRARYKQSLDPTVDDIKKLCMSLRRNAKEERVLLHYNGHGVPKPTANGEIWVFNKNYTQYIPLSMYDVQNWMGNPSIYVFDCSNAGILIESCLKFISQREKEMKMSGSQGAEDAGGQPGISQVSGAGSIMLAACGTGQILPMNPDLPADLFTACLTTPVVMAMRWHILVNSGKLVPGLKLEDLDKVPGSLNDRKSLLGELNWIFTAITDTIAWNMLPTELFQRLFRQDLLVASLFRNFLLAERIMRSYNCTPVSYPMLPPTYQHSMWNAWDLTLDLCLKQINTWTPKEDGKGENCPFFADQLQAFEVWLRNGSEKRLPPEQLPIVLQVLLSQIHRMCALDLLGRFLDLGPWAVSLALSVGIFPYVLKLLQSSAKELKPHLVFIWSKILAVDRVKQKRLEEEGALYQKNDKEWVKSASCQGDLVKDNGHKYFLSVMSDSTMSTWDKTMATFVTCIIMTEFRPGQEAALQGNVVSICLEQLDTTDRQYRHWLALCLGKVWTNFANARWCGVRDAAHEKLYPLLEDGTPEVRTAAVFALGTYISNCSERSDHANNIDLSVGMKLIPLVNDGSPQVRQELAAALAGLVTQFQSQFQSVAAQLAEEERREKKAAAVITGETPDSGTASSGLRRNTSRSSLKSMFMFPSTSNATMVGSTAGSLESYESVLPSTQRMRRVASSSSVSGLVGLSFSNVYLNVWNTLLTLAKDPHYQVALKAQTVVGSIHGGVGHPSGARNMSSATSAPSSPSGSMYSRVGTPPINKSTGGVAEDPRRRDHTSPTHQNKRDRNSPTHHHRRDHTSPTHQRNTTNNNATASSSSSSASYSLTYSRRRKIFDKGPDPPDGHEQEQAGGSTVVGVATQFFQWSCNYFMQPKLRQPPTEDPESVEYFRNTWHMTRNRTVVKQAKDTVLCSGINKLDDQLFVNKVNSTPTVVLFHPFEKFIAVNESHGVGFWDWEQGGRINYIENTLHVLPEKGAAITSMNFINAHSSSLLLCGTEDGAVRIWGDYLGKVKLITAFQALSDMQLVSKGAGLVTVFEQHKGTLYAAGDARYIRIWDAQTELKVRDIPTSADSCVTSLAIDSQGGSLVVAGCGDGTIRLFDQRMDPSDCRVTTLREHNSWVVNVHYQTGAVGKIISGSNCGEVKLWDPRFVESVNNFSLNTPLHAMSVHTTADIIACGCGNQSISIHSMSGDIINTIKYHDGFLGQRIGNITCLNFHPYNVMLGAGSMDNTLSVFGNPSPKS